MQGPGLSAGMRAAVVVAIVVGAYLIFEFGRIQANYNIVDAVLEQQSYESRIDGLEDKIADLKQQIALLETHREIEREAYHEVETNLTDLQRKIQEQRDAIAFYRGIVSPQDGGRGLQVQDLKLTRGKDERHYNLRLVLVQVMQHDRSVKGEVDFTLEGVQDGVATTYKLEQLLPVDSDSSWPFSFRYFQDFDRELILPDGFMPEKINVEVVSRTKSIASVKQSFDWLAGQS
jgi:cell division protein FtsB